MDFGQVIGVLICEVIYLSRRCSKLLRNGKNDCRSRPVVEVRHYRRKGDDEKLEAFSEV